jgi:hypothetical protein
VLRINAFIASLLNARFKTLRAFFDACFRHDFYLGPDDPHLCVIDKAYCIGEDGKGLKRRFGDNAHDEVVMYLVVGVFEDLYAGSLIAVRQRTHAQGVFMVVSLEIIAFCLDLPEASVEDLDITLGLEIGCSSSFSVN